MTTRRRSLHSRNTPIVYSMGSIHFHIIAGGRKPAQVAIYATRLDRTADDKFWSIIADLPPAEYKRLNELIAEAIDKFKSPGELYPSF